MLKATLAKFIFIMFLTKRTFILKNKQIFLFISNIFKRCLLNFFLSDYVSDSSSSDDSSSEDENFTDTKTILAQAELPPEFWQVSGTMDKL